MKKRTLLTPIDLSAATRGKGGVYEKQILPLGSINYKGRKINFDKKFLTDLAESFDAQAYDQVPLVFATPENQHNLDPKNFGGEIKGFRVKADGLYARIQADAETRKVLDKNPRLGVSARIVEGLEKSDGRRFDRAIQHVLLTMDPRVTGMKPWTTVDLSMYDGGAHQVVDLTALTIEKESEMPKIARTSSVKAPATTQEPQPDANGILDLSYLSDEQLDLLLSASDPVPAPKSKKVADPVDDDEDDEVDPDDVDDTDDEDSDDEDDDEDEGGADDADATDDLAAPKPNALVEALQAEKAARGGKGKKKVKGKPPVNLSTPAGRKTIDLASDALSSGDREALQAMREEVATERWESARKAYTKAGVPPFLLDLAAPLLSTPDAAVIDLSNGEDPINATKIVSDVLDGVKGLIDLRPEMGHRIDLSEDDENAKTEVEALADAWAHDRY